ncbi:hypothetical protein XMIN_2309 [Xanthomonas citri pv. mangiferaeindicae LMG 941]|nr:hypothetical protein XMIN_2309 [Xanthomonas citri pv. mangiferaeindicae LMG 941]
MERSRFNDAMAGDAGIAHAQQTRNFATHPSMRCTLMTMLGHGARGMPKHLSVVRLCHDLSPAA